MVDVVKGNSCNAQLVMLIFRPLHVYASVVLVVGLHAWQHLGIVHRVGIAEYLRHVVHHAHVPQDAFIAFGL